MAADVVIAEQKFRVCRDDQVGQLFMVTLFADKLLASPIGSESSCVLRKSRQFCIQSKDIVVCRPAAKKSGNFGHPVFMVVAWPMVNKGGKRRRRAFYFHTEDKYESGKIRDTWIHALSTSVNFGPSVLTPGEQRKILVVVNPNSGPGNAGKIAKNVLEPILRERGVDYGVVETQRTGHARDLVRRETDILETWSGIVCVSGDGTMSEIINGIYDRPDWKRVSAGLPVGIIPAGSGNGLSRSLVKTLDEPFDGKAIYSSSINVARGRTQNLDLFHVESPAYRLMGFLSITHGLIADIDMESERLRRLGGLRFAIYSVLLAARPRIYSAKLWYRQPGRETRTKLARHEELDDLHSNSYGTLMSQGKLYFRSWDELQDRVLPQNSSRSKQAFESVLPPLCEKLEEKSDGNWTYVEGYFKSITFHNTQFIDGTSMISPKSKLNDGLLYLVLIKASASKSTVIKFLTEMESGNHVNLPGIEMKAVTAFRLVPKAKKGHLVVDGESIPLGPIQGQVVPSALKIYVK